VIGIGQHCDNLQQFWFSKNNKMTLFVFGGNGKNLNILNIC